MDYHQNLKQQLEVHRRRQAILEVQAAAFGLQIPPHIQIEIEDITKKITELELKLKLPESIRTYIANIEEQEFRPPREPTKPIALEYVSGEVRHFLDDDPEVLKYLEPKYSYTLPTPDKNNPISIEQALTDNTWLVLLGPPGAGKSTTLRRLFRQYSQELKLQPDNIIPLYVQLNRWQEGLTLLEFLQKEGRELGSMLPILLKEGQVLLLLDGLNELPGLKRNKKTQTIDDPRSKAIAELSKDYPKVRCALSCRVKEFAGGPGWKELHVLPLSETQTRDFVASYYAGRPDGAALTNSLVEGLKDKNYQKLRELMALPFYLTRLVKYYLAKQEIPANPALLLQTSVEQALDSERKKGLLKTEEREELKERLSLLAFNMSNAETISANPKQAAYWFFYFQDNSNFYEKVEKEPNLSIEEQKQAEIWLKKVEGCGLVVLEWGEVKFVHQLFQEYFCACYFLDKPYEDFVVYGYNNGFDEVWAMYSSLNSSFVDYLINEIKDTLKYQIVGGESECLILGHIGDKKAVGSLLEVLTTGFGDFQYYAAIALGLIGDKCAIEPLIYTIKYHEKNGIRYSAATALGLLGDPQALQVLEEIAESDEGMMPFGKVKDAAKWAIGKIKEREGPE